MRLNVLLDPDPKKEYSELAFQHISYVSGILKGKIFVGGSPEKESPIEKEHVEKLIRRIKDYAPDAEVWCFPGHEKQVTEEADGYMIPCLYNGPKENFDERQIKFESLFGRRFRQAKGEDKVKYAFYVIRSPDASAFEAGRARQITDDDIVDAFNYWSNLGQFGFYYLEGGSGKEKPPWSIIKACYDPVVRKHNPESFFVGGGFRKWEEVLRLREEIPQSSFNLMIGNQLEYDPHEVGKMLSAASGKFDKFYKVKEPSVREDFEEGVKSLFE